MHVLYNVPYDKNPVEYVFSLLRKVLERSEFTTINELTKIVNNFKNNLINNKLNNIFRLGSVLLVKNYILFIFVCIFIDILTMKI